MDRFKAFFEEKKADIKFKKAGEGHRLDNSSEASSSSSGQKKAASRPPGGNDSKGAATSAACAASARQEAAQRGNRTVTGSAFRRQSSSGAESQAAAAASSSAAAATSVAGPEASAVAAVASGGASRRSANVTGAGGGDSLLFSIQLVCPMCTRSFGRPDRAAHLEQCMRDNLELEALSTSALMIHTLAPSKDMLKPCIGVIDTYLKNILANPTDPKYARIRTGNKAFQERVLKCPGSYEFFLAVGFKSVQQPKEEGAADEEFLILGEEQRLDEEHLSMCRDLLNGTEPLKTKLDRCFRVLRVSPGVTNFPLPPAFFRMSSEELKREQQRRTTEVESLTTLKTQAMRERDSQAVLAKYRYCVVRVRLPDKYILQAMFYPTETIHDVRLAVCSGLREEAQLQEFVLINTQGKKVDDESVTLAKAGWVPHAVITLRFVDEQPPGDPRVLSVALMNSVVTDY